MPLVVAIVGGALIAGGAAASSAAARSRRSAMRALGRAAIADFRDLGGEYQDMFTPVMDQFTKDRQTNMDLYRAEMQRAEQSFSKYFDQARAEYGAGMDRALGEMRIGRESTIEATRQETQRQQAAQAASNAFTGLGQTTFGQQRVQNIGAQGALREGMIREQYAGQLSALEAQRAQGMSTLSAQMGQGISGMEQMMATNLSNLYQTYSGNIANMQQQALSNQFNMYQQGLNIGYKFRGQAAELRGAGTSVFGSALNSIGGSLLGAGLGGMGAPSMSTPNTYSGLYTNQAGMDVNGGYHPSGGAVGGR